MTFLRHGGGARVRSLGSRVGTLWRTPVPGANRRLRRHVMSCGLYLDAAPANPSDGQPLRYKRTDTDAIVYSIGFDGVDNGGVDLSAEDDNDQDNTARQYPPYPGTDITFTIRR